MEIPLLIEGCYLLIYRSLKISCCSLQIQSGIIEQRWIHYCEYWDLSQGFESVFIYWKGDVQAQTPKPKNCAVITLSSLWNLTAPECDGLLNPRPAVFLITAESPPGKYAFSIYAQKYTSILPLFSLWVFTLAHLSVPSILVSSIVFCIWNKHTN